LISDRFLQFMGRQRVTAARLPDAGLALGVDWSGGKDAYKKVWGAQLKFGRPGPELISLGRCFETGGPQETAETFSAWLARQRFDVAGLDFCFALAEEHLEWAGLPLTGPADIGGAIRTRWASPEAFRQELGVEKKRQTDVDCSAPYAPTNLRMFRQTFWGLWALAGLEDSTPPWSQRATRNIVEVLPTDVARKICPECSYKDKGSAADRERMIRAMKDVCRLRVSAEQQRLMAQDRCGDAIDSVLAAFAAASAWATGFEGVPAAAASSGEGWIFSLRTDIPPP
jgi:hypothetical protein